MAKTKATKTAKVRVAVFYNNKGRYMASGDWMDGKRLSNENLIANLAAVCEDADVDMDSLPHTSIVDIELPIPELRLLHGKVTKMKAVKAVKT